MVYSRKSYYNGWFGGTRFLLETCICSFVQYTTGQTQSWMDVIKIYCTRQGTPEQHTTGKAWFVSDREVPAWARHVASLSAFWNIHENVNCLKLTSRQIRNTYHCSCLKERHGLAGPKKWFSHPWRFGFSLTTTCECCVQELLKPWFGRFGPTQSTMSSRLLFRWFEYVSMMCFSQKEQTRAYPKMATGRADMDEAICTVSINLSSGQFLILFLWCTWTLHGIFISPQQRLKGRLNILYTDLVWPCWVLHFISQIRSSWFSLW